MDPKAFLDNIAAAATARLPYVVRRSRPRDLALNWKSNAIHPLQILETEYQGVVREAAGGTQDPQEIKKRESRALSNYFMLDKAQPSLLGPPPVGAESREALPMPQSRLAEATRLLATASRQLRFDPGTISWKDFSANLAAVKAALLAACESLLHVPEQGRDLEVMEVFLALKGLDVHVVSAPRAREVDGLLGKALELLTAAATGPASVQMLYVIEPFCLFRLLVRYRVDFGGPLGEREAHEAETQASRMLTGLLNNNYPWLSTWLRDKIVDLGNRVRRIDNRNVLFYLKGGRAFKYLIERPDQGQNDWDTQILINPYLEARHWYELYRAVSNVVLQALTDFRIEFGAEIRRQPGPVQALPSTLPQPTPAEALPSEPVEFFWGVEHGEDGPPQPPDARTWDSCKAELIDVSLPRYDSVEALGQWDRLSGRHPHGISACVDDGMPFPGPGYYIDEYVLMIREVFTGRAPNPDKMPARLERLRRILDMPSTAAVITEARRHLQLFPKSLREIDSSLVSIPVRNVLTVLLGQFGQAYGLAAEPSLAKAFDEWFARNVPEAGSFARYDAGMREGLRPDDRGLADMIGYCQEVSERMEAHFQEREKEFVLTKEKILVQFLRDFVDESFFRPKDELEVQLAIRGSFGARLQLGYSRFLRPELDPVIYMSVGLYSYDREAKPWYILELVAPLVKELLEKGKYPLTLNPGVPVPHPVPEGHALRIYWAEPLRIAPLGPYHPLALEITATPPPAWPLLSYVWGLPTLSLRDMIREYRNEAAATEETGRRIILRRTADALAELMTRALEPPREPILLRSKL